VTWDQRFFDPIMVPGRKPLVTLRDAALYITELPKAEHDAEEWQAAMQTAIARRRKRRACNVRPHRRHEGLEPSRRAGVHTHWGRRKFERETSEAASRDCDPTGRHLPITSSQPNRLRPPARSSAGPARDSSVDCAGLLCFVLAG